MTEPPTPVAPSRRSARALKSKSDGEAKSTSSSRRKRKNDDDEETAADAKGTETSPPKPKRQRKAAVAKKKGASTAAAKKEGASTAAAKKKGASTTPAAKKKGASTTAAKKKGASTAAAAKKKGPSTAAAAKKKGASAAADVGKESAPKGRSKRKAAGAASKKAAAGAGTKEKKATSPPPSIAVLSEDERDDNSDVENAPSKQNQSKQKQRKRPASKKGGLVIDPNKKIPGLRPSSSSHRDNSHDSSAAASSSSSSSSSSSTVLSRFRSRSHSVDFGAAQEANNPSTAKANTNTSEHAHVEDPFMNMAQPVQARPTMASTMHLQQSHAHVRTAGTTTLTPLPSPANSPPTTPLSKPLPSRSGAADHLPPLSAPSKLLGKSSSAHLGGPMPVRPQKQARLMGLHMQPQQQSAPATIQRSQTPQPILSTAPHSSLNMLPSSSSSSSSSTSSPRAVRKPARGCGWSPRVRNVTLPRSLVNSVHQQCATHCHGPMLTARQQMLAQKSSSVYRSAEAEVYEHTNCVRQSTQEDMGPRAVAVRTVRRGPYQKLCIDPDGNQYLLKDDSAAVEIWMVNSSEPRTVSLTGRIGTVRGMVWCNGRLYLTDWMYSNILEVNLDDGRVKRFVGMCQHGSIDGSHSNAQFNRPWGIHADHEAQCLYVADCANNRIRKVCLRTRYTTTVAGSGVRGHTDGVPHAASFFRPSGIAVSCDHSVYVTEFSNVRQVTHTGMSSGGAMVDEQKGANSFLKSCFAAADEDDELSFDQVSTVTGKGRQITSSDTRLYRPRYVVEASDGSLILADCGNFRLRMVSPDRRSIKTIAGDGEERSIDMELSRASQRLSGKSNHRDASFRWIYSMALCQHSDTLYVVQDDGTLREIELKFPSCVTDRVRLGIERSDIGHKVPTDLVNLIQKFCYR